MRAEVWLVAGRRGDEEPITALVRAWLASFPSEHTFRAYRRDILGWLVYLQVSRVDPFHVARAHVDAYARWMEKTGVNAPTRARRLSAISSLYTYGLRATAAGELVQPIRANPAEHVARPAVERNRARKLTVDEVQALMYAVDHDADPYGPAFRVIIRLLAHNTLRVGEVCKLDKHDVLSTGHLRVRRKRGAITTEPLNEPTLAALAAYLAGPAPAAPPGTALQVLPAAARELGRWAQQLPRNAGDEPLFILEQPHHGPARRSAGPRITREAIRTRVQLYAERAGIDRPHEIGPHTLRHSGLSAAADHVPVHRVVELARHASAATTMDYYVHPDPSGHAVHVLGQLFE